MRARGVTLVIVSTGLALSGAHLARAQEATSANLPDQFQTGEMIQTQKPKKEKTESTSQTLATAPKQNIAPAPKQIAPVEEPPAATVPSEEKKAEPGPGNASRPPSQKPASVADQAHSAEELETPVVSVENKPPPKKQPRPAVQPEVASIPAPVPMSLSVAQSMAISAPLPDYTYEAKRRNLTGNGVCVVTVDAATGRVTDARMFQSTGSTILDKLTIQTFKSWRFKPRTVSQVRVPISYE
jgi:TonB family protein